MIEALGRKSWLSVRRLEYYQRVQGPGFGVPKFYVRNEVRGRAGPLLDGLGS